MTTSLFSTYRQGENRITSTLIAVLERLSLPNIDRILQALLEDGDFNLVTFRNQIKVKKLNTIPDAHIGTGHAIFIETKTKRDDVRKRQIKGHLKHVQCNEKLLVLTPDESKPTLLSEKPFANDERVVWANFITLAGVIEEILSDEDEPPTEKEAFLLREFVRMIQQDGLLFSSEGRVLVIAAREAWPVYENISAYITHARGHQPSEYLAFYADREIKTIVPKIKRIIESVNLSQDGISELEGEDRKCAKALLIKLDKIGKYQGFTAKVFFLSTPKDQETKTLKEPIKNDKIGKNGRRVPFTYGAPIYVTLESLKKVSKTSGLVRC